MKILTKSQKLFLTLASAVALIAGAAFASTASIIWFHQPKCPQHLLK